MSNVNHPKHYNAGKIEPIAVIRDWRLGFSLGNAVKYIARAKHKGSEIEDLKKAAWYLNEEIATLEAEFGKGADRIGLTGPMEHLQDRSWSSGSKLFAAVLLMAKYGGLVAKVFSYDANGIEWETEEVIQTEINVREINRRIIANYPLFPRFYTDPATPAPKIPAEVPAGGDMNDTF